MFAVCLGAKLVCYFETKQLVQQQQKLEKDISSEKILLQFCVKTGHVCGPDVACDGLLSYDSKSRTICTEYYHDDIILTFV